MKCVFTNLTDKWKENLTCYPKRKLEATMFIYAMDWELLCNLNCPSEEISLGSVYLKICYSFRPKLFAIFQNWQHQKANTQFHHL